MVSSGLNQGALTEGEGFDLTTLDQLLFIMKVLFTFIAKQASLMRRSTVLSPP